MDTNLSTTPTPTAPILAPDAQLGVSRLAVRELARSLPFYEDGLGLTEMERDADLARLGDGEQIVLELVQEPDARPAGRHAGLFHVALLYPTRIELARVAQRLMAHRIPIQGASDHGTHEAFYLSDPDGNGLELAADRPADEWPDPQQEYVHGPQPLDVRALMSLVDGQRAVSRAEPGVRVGHLHLHVGDIDEALAFYRDVVGFELQAQLPTAAFVSLGGYHHHLGMNVWKGSGVPAAPDDAIGLRSWTVQVPDTHSVRELAQRLDSAGIEYRHEAGALAVRDPWNIELRVEPQAR